VPIIMNKEVAFVILLGIIGSTPLIRNWLLRPGLQIGGETVQVPSYSARWLPAARVAFVSVVLGLAVMEMASGTYNPFIYFRF
jgi:hypothetical protein